MTLEEKKAIIKAAVDVSNGRIPIIAGTGGNNTKEVIKMSNCAKELGVDGLLIVTPYYNKCTQNGLIKHYKEIANNVDLPIIVYSVPGRTGVNIEPHTCLELSKIDNIVAIKEASGNLSQVAKIKSLCGDNLQIYSGNDDQILPVLSLGGIGVISVLSNVLPKYTHCMTDFYFNNQIDKATKLQIDAIPLINNLFSEVNPIPAKEALNMLGFNFGTPRLPLTKLSDEKYEPLKTELFKLIEKEKSLVSQTRNNIIDDDFYR